MKRRSLFRLAVTAIVASSIEVMGWSAGECAAKLNDEEAYREKMYREATFDMTGYDKFPPYPFYKLDYNLDYNLNMPTWDWTGKEWVRTNPPSVN